MYVTEGQVTATVAWNGAWVPHGAWTPGLAWPLPTHRCWAAPEPKERAAQPLTLPITKLMQSPGGGRCNSSVMPDPWPGPLTHHCPDLEGPQSTSGHELDSVQCSWSVRWNLLLLPLQHLSTFPSAACQLSFGNYISPASNPVSEAQRPHYNHLEDGCKIYVGPILFSILCLQWSVQEWECDLSQAKGIASLEFLRNPIEFSLKYSFPVEWTYSLCHPGVAWCSERLCLWMGLPHVTPQDWWLQRDQMTLKEHKPFGLIPSKLRLQLTSCHPQHPRHGGS